MEAKILRHTQALRSGDPAAAAEAIAALARIGEDDVAGSIRWPDVLAGLGALLGAPDADAGGNGSGSGSPSREAALAFLQRLFRRFRALPSNVQMAQVFCEVARHLLSARPHDPGVPEAAAALAEMGAVLPMHWQGLPEPLLAEATSARVALIACRCAAEVDAQDPLAHWCGEETAWTCPSRPNGNEFTFQLLMSFCVRVKRSHFFDCLPGILGRGCGPSAPPAAPHWQGSSSLSLSRSPPL